ncbi:MAG: serine hydrolase [Myxococcota bacterium]
MSRLRFEQGPVQGDVAPGFESVKRLYARETETMAERNTQLCVYHRGRKVVDLWRAAADDSGFSPDSLVNVFSSGKSLETIAMAHLVDRGLLRFDDRVESHWPEFASHGKESLRVADVMRHEGGMAAFDASLAPDDTLRERIKDNAIGRIVEGQKLRFRSESEPREYHAITRGWIANEIFRRVDPAGRTMGEYFRDEISGPLGADVRIGVEDRDVDRVSPVEMPSLRWQFLETLRPRALGRRIKLGFLQLIGRLLRLLWTGRNATSRSAPQPFTEMRSVLVFNDPIITAGETPSAGTKASARGLARVAALMAARGRWDGKDYLGSAAWEAAHAEPTEAHMILAPTDFTQGGVNRFSAAQAAKGDLGRALNAGREGFYGWMGLGGSIFQWHPEAEIGFAFVPTSLHAIDLCNERGKVYQAEVVRCVGSIAG